MQLLSTPSESVNQTKITEMSNGSCNLFRVPSIETFFPFLYSDIENPLVPDVYIGSNFVFPSYASQMHA